MASEALQAQALAQASVRAAPTATEKKMAEKKGGKNSPRGPQVLGAGTGTWAGTASEGLDERLALSVVEAIVEFSGEPTPVHSVLSNVLTSCSFVTRFCDGLVQGTVYSPLSRTCQPSGPHNLVLLSLSLPYFAGLLIALLLRSRSTRGLSESPAGGSEGMCHRPCCWWGEGESSNNIRTIPKVSEGDERSEVK
jgi:hypothetical protein